MTALIMQPAFAQEDDEISPMTRGMQQLLEGLILEMEPAWRELQSFMDVMGPAMIDLMEEVKDWSAYEAPEILDNGDIIIRRKPDPPLETPNPEPAPNAPEQIEI